MNFLATNAPATPRPNRLMVAGSGTRTVPAIADPAIIARPNATPAIVMIRSVIQCLQFCCDRPISTGTRKDPLFAPGEFSGDECAGNPKPEQAHGRRFRYLKRRNGCHS